MQFFEHGGIAYELGKNAVAYANDHGGISYELGRKRSSTHNIPATMGGFSAASSTGAAATAGACWERVFCTTTAAGAFAEVPAGLEAAAEKH